MMQFCVAIFYLVYFELNYLISPTPGLHCLAPPYPLLFFIYLFLKFIYLFMAALGLRCCAQAFLQLWRAGATLRCGVQASHCGGFSCSGARALECRLSSRGTRAQLLRGMWNLPGPGLEPVSPALADGFSTTAPPGKPHPPLLNLNSSPVYPPATLLSFSSWNMSIPFLP